MISVIIPAYNEEKNISIAAQRITSVLDENGIDHELIFVNDGSADKTWEQICAESAKDSRVKGICFSRNFGKESAIFAGLKYAKGDAAVLIDCDMQHPPETIVEMYNIWKNNDVDIVEGKKASRGKENIIYKAFSKMFYGLIKRASGLDMTAASDRVCLLQCRAARTGRVEVVGKVAVQIRCKLDNLVHLCAAARGNGMRRYNAADSDNTRRKHAV